MSPESLWPSGIFSRISRGTNCTPKRNPVKSSAQLPVNPCKRIFSSLDLPVNIFLLSSAHHCISLYHLCITVPNRHDQDEKELYKKGRPAGQPFLYCIFCHRIIPAKKKVVLFSRVFHCLCCVYFIAYISYGKIKS